MNTSNPRLARGTVSGSLIGYGDWRAQMQPGSRQTAVNEIMAVKLEEKFYTAANSQSSYGGRVKVPWQMMEMGSNSTANTVSTSNQASKEQTAIKRKADFTGNPNGGDWQEVYQKETGRSNQRPTQGSIGIVGDSSMDSGDWRSQLQTDFRKRIMNKIMDTLKTHIPFSGDEGQQELQKIAVRFEEKIFNAASSQSDYLYKISLKMLTAEDIFEDFLKDAYSEKPSGPGSPAMQTVNYNVKPLAIHFSANDTQPTQQYMLLPFMHNISSKPVQASQDLTDQTGNLNGGDWQEEAYQKIKAMKDLYLQDLNNLHQKIFARLQKFDSLPQVLSKNDHIEKLKVFKNMLESFMQFLLIPKHGILANYKDKLGTYEKQIVNVINSSRRKPTPTQQQGQAPPPTHMHPVQKQSQQTHFQSKQVQDGSDSVGDWRAQMAASFRPRIVNIVDILCSTDTLKKHLSLYRDQGLLEVKSIAESFEENVYTAATNQFDYEQKISLILNLKSRQQNHMTNA